MQQYSDPTDYREELKGLREQLKTCTGDTRESIEKSISRLEAQLMQDDSLKLKTTDESLRIDQVKGDGNCLYYATNKSHHTATTEYLGTHDELRLLTGTLTLRYLDLP